MPKSKGVDQVEDGTTVVENGLRISGEVGNVPDVERNIRWNDTTKRYEFYNGLEWQNLGSSGGWPDTLVFPTTTMFIELEMINATPVIPTSPSGLPVPNVSTVELQTFIDEVP